MISYAKFHKIRRLKGWPAIWWNIHLAYFFWYKLNLFWYQQYSFPRLFVPWNIRSHDGTWYGNWTTRRQTNSPTDKLADKPTRRQTNSPTTNSPTNQIAEIDILTFRLWDQGLIFHAYRHGRAWRMEIRNPCLKIRKWNFWQCFIIAAFSVYDSDQWSYSYHRHILLADSSCPKSPSFSRLTCWRALRGLPCSCHC